MLPFPPGQALDHGPERPRKLVVYVFSRLARGNTRRRAIIPMHPSRVKQKSILSLYANQATCLSTTQCRQRRWFRGLGRMKCMHGYHLLVELWLASPLDLLISAYRVGRRNILETPELAITSSSLNMLNASRNIERTKARSVIYRATRVSIVVYSVASHISLLPTRSITP